MPSLRRPRPYADPYIAGVGLGLVLLAAFVVAGRGLGASGAFGATATGIVRTVDPSRASGSAYFNRYLDSPGGPWREWLLFEIAGVIVGGYVSAWNASTRAVPAARSRFPSSSTCHQALWCSELSRSRCSASGPRR